MANKPNFLRLFHDAFEGVRTSGNLKLTPLYTSIEETILSAKYTTASPNIVKFFYENTDLSDKELANIYYDNLPKPPNIRNIGDVMQAGSVRNRRKQLSDHLYLAFGDDFFQALVSRSNYREVNWRKNIINHDFYNISKLLTSDVAASLQAIATKSKHYISSTISIVQPSRNATMFPKKLLNYEESTTGTFFLEDCREELDFIYRYLNPALSDEISNLDPEKVSYILLALEGVIEKTTPGTRLSALEQILSRSAFARPAREGR